MTFFKTKLNGAALSTIKDGFSSISKNITGPRVNPEKKADNAFSIEDSSQISAQPANGNRANVLGGINERLNALTERENTLAQKESRLEELNTLKNRLKETDAKDKEAISEEISQLREEVRALEEETRRDSEPTSKTEKTEELQDRRNETAPAQNESDVTTEQSVESESEEQLSSNTSSTSSTGEEALAESTSERTDSSENSPQSGQALQAPVQSQTEVNLEQIAERKSANASNFSTANTTAESEQPVRQNTTVKQLQERPEPKAQESAPQFQEKETATNFAAKSFEATSSATVPNQPEVQPQEEKQIEPKFSSGSAAGSQVKNSEISNQREANEVDSNEQIQGNKKEAASAELSNDSQKIPENDEDSVGDDSSQQSSLNASDPNEPGISSTERQEDSVGASEEESSLTGARTAENEASDTFGAFFDAEEEENRTPIAPRERVLSDQNSEPLSNTANGNTTQNQPTSTNETVGAEPLFAERVRTDEPADSDDFTESRTNSESTKRAESAASPAAQILGRVERQIGQIGANIQAEKSNVREERAAIAKDLEQIGEEVQIIASKAGNGGGFGEAEKLANNIREQVLSQRETPETAVNAAIGKGNVTQLVSLLASGAGL